MKQTFKIHSSGKLTSFVKKFSVIEKSLLFEIAGDRLIAKTHTPDKSVVKMGSSLLTDTMDPETVPGTDVKIGLFEADNFISSFKHFGESVVKLDISSEEISGSGNVATELKAFSKNLKVSFPCASMSLFRYIDAALATRISDTTAAVFSFRIDKDSLSKVSSLCSLDSDNDSITIESKDGKVFFSGKSFEMEMEGVTSTVDNSVTFYKAHFGFVDKEDSEIFVTDTKVIFKSLESDTVCVIGKVE